jgi:hypothetical protein
MNINLFDSKGRLRADVDTSAFDPVTLARLNALREAQDASDLAQAEHDSAQNEVHDAATAVREAEDFYSKNWKPPTFHDLWKQTFGRE